MLDTLLSVLICILSTCGLLLEVYHILSQYSKLTKRKDADPPDPAKAKWKKLLGDLADTEILRIQTDYSSSMVRLARLFLNVTGILSIATSQSTSSVFPTETKLLLVIVQIFLLCSAASYAMSTRRRLRGLSSAMVVCCVLANFMAAGGDDVHFAQLSAAITLVLLISGFLVLDWRQSLAQYIVAYGARLFSAAYFLKENSHTIYFYYQEAFYALLGFGFISLVEDTLRGRFKAIHESCLEPKVKVSEIRPLLADMYDAVVPLDEELNVIGPCPAFEQMINTNADGTTSDHAKGRVSANTGGSGFEAQVREDDHGRLPALVNGMTHKLEKLEGAIGDVDPSLRGKTVRLGIIDSQGNIFPIQVFHIPIENNSSDLKHLLAILDLRDPPQPPIMAEEQLPDVPAECFNVKIARGRIPMHSVHLKVLTAEDATIISGFTVNFAPEGDVEALLDPTMPRLTEGMSQADQGLLHQFLVSRLRKRNKSTTYCPNVHMHLPFLGNLFGALVSARILNKQRGPTQIPSKLSIQIQDIFLRDEKKKDSVPPQRQDALLLDADDLSAAPDDLAECPCAENFKVAM
eukprot:TRINITY_DN50849_c0_g1_i1.p1 TRINITY_DN50849_c0_g1~~TRINITY_DN50849_c0_g1_i1.p1  ORF type:complete len:576 (+),score=79.95 TRINITY_DN50849_c0_g1_i1:117-1844(+)